jgi:hypothetical protein
MSVGLGLAQPGAASPALRHLRPGWYRAADLGGGFAALPSAAATITSALLYVAGVTTFMAVINSTAGGSLDLQLRFNPPTVSDPIYAAVAGPAGGGQCFSFGKNGVAPGSPIAPALTLVTLIWNNGGTLNDFQLFLHARR